MKKKNLKRCLSLLVAGIMLVTGLTMSASASSGYADVSENSDCYEAVTYLRDINVMKGTGGNNFSPTAELSRGMLVTVLHRLEGTPTAQVQTAFTDVANGTWYSDAVAWAEDIDLINDYGDGMFQPDHSVTDLEMGAILSRYQGKENANQSDWSAGKPVTRAQFANAIYEMLKEQVVIAVDNSLYGEGCTIGTTVNPGEGYSTLKAEEGGKIVYADSSKAVFTFRTVDMSKLDLSGAKVTLGEGDGYYVSDMLFTGGTLTPDKDKGILTFTMDSDDLTFNNDQGYTVDNGGLEWSAQGGDGGGRYYFNLVLSGVKYDGRELPAETVRLKIYIYGREFSTRNSPMGNSGGSRWGVGMLNNVVLPVAEEKALENKPTVDSEPVWTWVGDNSAGKPILCDCLTDDFYISWPAGVDASSIKDQDVRITLTSQYGDKRVLTPNIKIKTDPDDVAFLPDGEYSVYSSKDTTQISVNLVNWAYTPVYNKMTISVNGASKTYDVGSVYQYSVQQGGGLDYDKTVTCATVFGIADLGDYTNEQLFKESFTYSWVFEDENGNKLIYVEHDDGSYETVRQSSSNSGGPGGGTGGPGGGTGGGPSGQQSSNPEGSEFPSDADVRFVGNTVYGTNHEDEKKVVVHTDDPDFAKYDGQEVIFKKSYNHSFAPVVKMDPSIEFKVAEGYVKTAKSYSDHMNWAWASFVPAELRGWIDPNIVPAQTQGGGQQGGPGGQQGGGPQH